MLKKKLLLLALSLSLIFGGVVSAQDEPIRIGLLTDESGALSIYGYELDYGFHLGLLYAAGIDPLEYDSIDDAMADVTIAGRPVEVLIRDNGSDPAVAADQARELIEAEGVEILVGAPSSGVTAGLQQVALDNEVMLFVAPGASPTITGEGFNVNTVRVCRNSFQDFLAFVPYATEEIGTNFVQLVADYDFGRASAGASRAVLGSAGINFIQDDILAPLETADFTPFLQEVLDSGADALLPIWAGDTTIALFQQIDELGVADAMAVVAAFNSNDIVAVSDPSTIGNVSWIVYHHSFPETEANDWMVERHVEFYPNPITGGVDYPDLFTECGFATAQAVYMALTTTDGDTLPEAVIPVIEGMSFDGPKGTYYIRPSDHQALLPMYVAQLDNLDDPEFEFYTLLQETSAFDTMPPCLLPEALAERCAMDAEWLEEMMAMGDE
ncbi:MAG: substrate-binding domain-containing protein [Phototrophicaceae bacterium]